MTLLFDTNALLWWLVDDTRLSKLARDALTEPDVAVFVSPASVWEIAIKENLGKLSAPNNWLERLEEERITPLPITHRHARDAGRLPLHHRDPFDRLLIAQAQAEELTVVTRDPRFTTYGVNTIPA